jgi:hypothetical protein
MPLSVDDIVKLVPPEPVELGKYTGLDDATAEIEEEYPSFPGGPRWAEDYDEYCSWAAKPERILKAHAAGIITLSEADITLVERGKASLEEDVDDADIEVRLRELRPDYAALFTDMSKVGEAYRSLGKEFDVERVRAVASHVFDAINRTQIVDGVELIGNKKLDLQVARDRFRDLMFRFCLGFCSLREYLREGTTVTPELVSSLPNHFVLVHHLLLDKFYDRPTETAHMFTGYPYGCDKPAFVMLDWYGAKGFANDELIDSLPSRQEIKRSGGRGRKGRRVEPKRDPKFWGGPEDAFQKTLHGEKFGAEVPLRS